VSKPFQTLQNGYQIVSDGKSVKEIFGSLAKERDFRTLEIRTQHRSEYRKEMTPSEPFVRPATMPFGSAHAAMLYHAGQFLTALALTIRLRSTHSRGRGKLIPLAANRSIHSLGHGKLIRRTRGGDRSTDTPK